MATCQVDHGFFFTPIALGWWVSDPPKLTRQATLPMATTTEIHSEWAEHYPFESRWLELPAGRLHYLDEGPTDNEGDPDPAAPVILFVHGNPTWTFHWRRLIDELSGTCRCIAIDHLGCGLSDKPQKSFRLADRINDLGKLIDHLELNDITLVAQDWGGAIGLGTMLDRKERLARVLLFNTGLFRLGLYRTGSPSVERQVLARLDCKE